MSSFIGWISGKTDKERDIAEKVARERTREALDAQDTAIHELRAKEAALRAADEAHKRAEDEKKAKESAEQTAREAQCEKERFFLAAKDAKTRAEREQQEKEEARRIAKIEKEAREKEKIESAARLQQAENEKAELADIANHLRSDKEEREKLEAEQRSFKWGPKKMPKWTDGEVERLVQSVLKSRKDTEGNPVGLKLLVFGPTGHGKSSFCNGCRSALKGDDHPSTYYPVANVRVTLTRGFHGAPYGDHWIIDMAGIFESKRINSVNIEDIASGKIPFYAEITDTLEVMDKGTVDLPAPGENDVSCVVIVLRYDTELGPELRRQIEVIVALGGKGVISYHLVLTHLDECDPQFNDTDNLPNLYQSPRVQAAVKRMSEETGIPPYAISFIKNYTTETETDNNSSLLHLRVLERVVKSALDQVEKNLDKKRQRALYSAPKKRQTVPEVAQSENQGEKSGISEDANVHKEKQVADRHQQGKGLTDNIFLLVSDLKFIIIVLLIAVAVIYAKIYFFV